MDVEVAKLEVRGQQFTHSLFIVDNEDLGIQEATSTGK